MGLQKHQKRPLDLSGLQIFVLKILQTVLWSKIYENDYAVDYTELYNWRQHWVSCTEAAMHRA